MKDIRIRNVAIADPTPLLEIYAPYVTDTAISFEYDVPSQEEFEDRIKNISSSFPYLVAEVDGKIVGYAYAGTFKARKAYDHCVE
ncbi:MAG: GNAT family N-acetyltransferase, partial [Bacteroidales bacterium]|nr:GNAT family N-acetyltransferase [Bacteroidales bacterium]